MMLCGRVLAMADRSLLLQELETDGYIVFVINSGSLNEVQIVSSWLCSVWNAVPHACCAEIMLMPALRSKSLYFGGGNRGCGNRCLRYRSS